MTPTTTALPLKTLQAGRAAAALAVTAFHLSLMMGEGRYGGDAVLGDWTALGKLGVDFFFVLSGFVMMHAHRTHIGQPTAWPAYAWSRVVRVYPVYWLYLTLFVAMVNLGIGQSATLPAGGLEWLSAYTLIRFSPADPPLYVAWTLFHEITFYALFGLLILHRGLGTAALAAWVLLCLWQFQDVGVRPPDAWLTYTALPNMNFLLGMGAHWLWRRGHAGWPALIAGLGLLVAMPTMELLQLPGGTLGVALGCALLVAGACALERQHPARWPRALLAIGDASYSLYLLHLPLSGLVLKGLVGSGARYLLGGVGSFLVTMAATTWLAWLAYRLIEEPLIRWLKTRGPRVYPRTRAGLAGSTVRRGL